MSDVDSGIGEYTGHIIIHEHEVANFFGPIEVPQGVDHVCSILLMMPQELSDVPILAK